MADTLNILLKTFGNFSDNFYGADNQYVVYNEQNAVFSLFGQATLYRIQNIHKRGLNLLRSTSLLLTAESVKRLRAVAHIQFGTRFGRILFRIASSAIKTRRITRCYNRFCTTQCHNASLFSALL